MKLQQEPSVAVTTQHTPGPWQAVPVLDTRHSPANVLSRTVEVGGHPDHNDGWCAAVCYGPDRAANARLIAAAPQLLEALVHFKTCVEILTQEQRDDLPNCIVNAYGLAHDAAAAATNAR